MAELTISTKPKPLGVRSGYIRTIGTRYCPRSPPARSTVPSMVAVTQMYCRPLKTPMGPDDVTTTRVTSAHAMLIGASAIQSVTATSVRQCLISRDKRCIVGPPPYEWSAIREGHTVGSAVDSPIIPLGRG